MEQLQYLAAQHAAYKALLHCAAGHADGSGQGPACKWRVLVAELQCAWLRRVPEEAPQEVSDLVQRCIIFDPNARPDAEECVSVLTPFATSALS